MIPFVPKDLPYRSGIHQGCSFHPLLPLEQRLEPAYPRLDIREKFFMERH